MAGKAIPAADRIAVVVGTVSLRYRLRLPAFAFDILFIGTLGACSGMALKLGRLLARSDATKRKQARCLYFSRAGKLFCWQED